VDARFAALRGHAFLFAMRRGAELVPRGGEARVAAADVPGELWVVLGQGEVGPRARRRPLRVRGATLGISPRSGRNAGAWDRPASGGTPGRCGPWDRPVLVLRRARGGRST
jgi:hypothetical protein